MRGHCSLSLLASKSVCLLLTYTLVVSICAPFALKRVEAATISTAANKKAHARAAAEKRPAARREDELIVRFRRGTSEQERTALAEAKGARRVRKLRGRAGAEKLRLQRGKDLEAVAAELRQSPGVELVEFNYLVEGAELLPNDARFAEQWALKNTAQTGGQAGSDINATAAWETTTGAASTVIAVIDSGVDFSHPDLQNNRWANSAEQLNGEDDDHNGLVDDLSGWDFVAGDSDAQDEQGHGTMMAGAIAAEGNNWTGISGVMWRASLMSLRVLNNTGTGDVAAAVEAIDYATDNGALVINCSWGTDGESVFLRDAIERAGRRGVVVVTSSGNGGRDITSEPQYPASYGLPNVIAVASTDHNDQLASWSNYGPTQVAVAAPGTDVLTTEAGAGYRTATGTSVSAALVTGVVGLVRTVSPWLGPAETKAAVVNGARQVPALAGKVSSGGVVSARGALDSLPEPGATPTPSPAEGNQTPGEPVPEGLPDLDAYRDIEPAAPAATTQIVANTLPVCDADCGGSIPTAGTTNPADTDFSTERTDPMNATGGSGVNLLSRNFNWGVPVVSLPGRSGLDLGLALIYNSLVWTKQNGAIRFNADRGFPGAGFRLGFPVIQQRYYNSDTLKYAYMMVTPSGSRVELRQVGTSTAYESADGSYIRMIDNGAGGALVLTPDGTKMTYGPFVNNEMHCTEVKDRNGNYLTIAYNSLGRPTSVIDTLSRTVTFVYDANGYLTSIRQTWNGVTHTWATFSYGTLVIQTNFSNLAVEGPVNGSSIPVLTQVGLDDGSRYNFEYTSWGQVWKISHSAADGHLLSYTSFNLPLTAASAQTDCPRPTQQRDWAEDWNGDTDGVPATAEEVLTQYSTAANGSSGQVTLPDNTIYKELYATAGWQRGLVTGTENWSGGEKRKWTTTSWTQDDTTATYQVNPRPDETNVYDEAQNRRRTTVSYYSTAYFSLPSDVYEYDKDGTTILRRTHTEYNFSTAYVNNATNRRIIGLVAKRQVKDGAGNLASQVEYQYDEGGIYFDTSDAPARHDSAGYGTAFLAGRGNLTSVRRVNVTTPTQVSEWNIGYNVAGSPVLRRDPLSHYTYIDYTDNFSDATKNTVGTYAYPTKVTDPGGFYATTQYHYGHGSVTKTSVPSSGTGTSITYLDHQMIYDTAGRLTKVLNLGDGSYTRWVYPTSRTLVQQYQTINTANAAGEVYSSTVLDGAGRTLGTSTEHTFGTTPTYSGQLFVYDKMGRQIKQSNPTEMTGAWAATGDDAAAGWKYTQQTYDWKGRPLKTTNADGTFSEMEYGGCGCAGGEVITLKGVQVTEGRRQQKVYKDTLGRVVKTEVLDWNGSVYSTTKNTYNVRDQVTRSRQYAGADTSTNFQDTVLTYDGHGRLATKKSPEQDAATTYAYFADDTVQKATDGRGAYTTFTYNSRHLVTSIAYTPSAGIADTPTVTFAYDAAGHRTSMAGGASGATYQYDALARLASETRTFSGLAGSYTLTYGYNLVGGLTSVTDPTGAVINYTLDQAGRTTAVTGSSFGGVTQYATNIKYRAWGGVKSLSYGNTRSLSVGYNTRLRPTHYEVPGVISKDYEYDADGGLDYSRDLLDGRFDRSYTRDHAGRVTEAFSGPMARGLADTGDRPYKQYYQYDAMGHLTGRVGSELWDNPGTMFPDTDTYVNNRNASWQYDADGRVTSGDGIQYTYDAAGRAVRVVSGDHTQAQSFDGGGVRAKIVDEEYVEDGSGATSLETETRYFVTSSVLGAVVTELDGTGQKVRGFVYGDGELLAWQMKDDDIESVRWEHRDPSGASFRMTGTSGALDHSRSAELDPLGSDAGVRSPFSLQGPPRPPEERQDLTYPGFADLLSGDCTLDGVPTPCGAVSRLMEAGGTGIETWIRDEEIKDAAGIRPGPQIPIEPRGVGLFTFWVSDDGKQRHDGDRGDVLVINKNEDALGHWETVSIGGQQNTVIGFDTLWEDLADIIKDGTCRSFIANLIGTAQEQTGKKAHAFSVEGMLAELKNNPADGSKDGIYLFETGGKELKGYGGWNKVTGKGWVEISDIIHIGGDIRAGHRALARMFLHEIIHTATKFGTVTQATGGYSDVEVARAIFGITGDWRDNPDDPRNKSPRGYQTTVGGVIFNRALQKYCK